MVENIYILIREVPIFRACESFLKFAIQCKGKMVALFYPVYFIALRLILPKLQDHIRHYCSPNFWIALLVLLPTSMVKWM